MAVMRMAHQNTARDTDKRFEKPGAVFHDFLGMKPGDSSLILSSKTVDFRLAEPSPSSASISIGASSGGARCPISTTSDVGSVERRVENHLEGVPFYGPRSDISVVEISNRLVGSKRSNSDSSFMGSSRDGFNQMAPDSLQNSHLMKILRNSSGGELHRRYSDDEVLGMQQLRQVSAAPTVYPPLSSKVDGSISKWERSILMNAVPNAQQLSRGVPIAPFAHQVGSSKGRDTHAGPSFVSQLAADEGSRTGMKGPVILSSVRASTPASENVPSGVLLSGSRQKLGTTIVEADAATPPSQSEPSRQMTIFYGGQAHVFDDVHPNKADIIMALAGSNGGSWSTTYSPKSPSQAAGNGNVVGGENEIVGVGNKRAYPQPQEFQGRIPTTAKSSHINSGDRLGGVSSPSGVHQRGSKVIKDTKRAAFQGAAETSCEEKRGL